MKKKSLQKRVQESFALSSKTLRVMRLTLFLFFLTVAQVFAIMTYSQSARLSLNLKNSAIKDVLYDIENQSEYYFLFNSKLVDVNRKVDITVLNESVEQILDKLFKGQHVEFTIMDRQIVIQPASEVTAGAIQQQRPVSGRVTDASGGPLPGVTVIINGTSHGTITDADGWYSLVNVPSDATLVFSFVGMKTREVAVTGKQEVNVMMEEDAIGIEEVVTIGYGTQFKKNISTAVSSVGSSRLEPLTAALNPGQALVGQISGVRLQQVSGAPGENPSIRIRGSGSITSGNNPLYVIDGFPTNDASLFAAILPTDIESIDILKDAAAAAIYGSRAGNGVIIVNTKKGKPGKTSFTADMVVGFETIANKYDLLRAKDFVEMAKEALTYNGKTIPDFLNDPSRWTETDWQDVIFRTAAFQKYQVTASGGTEKTRFSISGGYVDQQGVLVNSYLKRYNLRVALEANLTERLKAGVNLLPTYTESRIQDPAGQNNTSDMKGIIAEALSMPPVLPVYRSNGDHFVIFQDPELRSVFNDQLSNPLNKLEANHDYRKIFRQTANVFLEFTPVKNLKLNTTFNTGWVSGRREMYVSGIYARGGNKTGNISTPDLSAVDARRESYNNLNWYWSNTATYNLSVRENEFIFLAGYDVARKDDFGTYLVPRTDKDNPIAFDNFIVENIQGAVLNQGGSNFDEYVFDAVFGRINYSYKGKYLFSASLRRDRSSKFGPDNRSGIFPSLSGAWNISDEPFLDPVGWVSLLKIRASYGETGNDQLAGYYSWISTMSKQYYVFGQGADNRVITYKPSGFSNPELGWEKNRQTDLGFELGILKSRINLLVDLYKRNSNTILDASVPSVNGKSGTIIQNIGNVQNKGLEITIHTKNTVRQLVWKTDFNISFNRNEITKLGLNQTQLKNGTAGTFWADVVRNYKGRPMSDLYMYKVIGTFNNAQDVAEYPKMGTQDIGDLRYLDASGPDGVPDGKITANDMICVGNAQPDCVFGITNSFAFKGIDLTVLLDGVIGGKMINAMERPVSLNRNLENATAQAKDRWRSESDPGSGYSHRAGTKNLGTNIGPNTRFLYDADFLRIRNITLGYTLPAKLSGKIGVQNLRVFCSALNLHTFTDFPGYNPEGNYNGDSATNNGVDQGSYPVARNISFGLNVNF